jgi:hypothetical protein
MPGKNMTQPPLAVTQPDGTRRYQNPRTGETAPSVTTILRVLAKPAVENWKLRSTARYADANWDMLTILPSPERITAITSASSDYTEEKASIGTAVHELLEAIAKNNPAETTKITDPYLSQFSDFLMTRRPVFLGSEVTVWSREHEYAGTLDAILRIGDDTLIVDYKTSKGVYPEFSLQLAALCGADFILRSDGSEEEYPPVTGAAVLQVRPRSWHLVPVRHQDDCYAAFLHARELYRWQEETAPRVFLEAA